MCLDLLYMVRLTHLRIVMAEKSAPVVDAESRVNVQEEITLLASSENRLHKRRRNILGPAGTAAIVLYVPGFFLNMYSSVQASNKTINPTIYQRNKEISLRGWHPAHLEGFHYFLTSSERPLRLRVSANHPIRFLL